MSVSEDVGNLFQRFGGDPQPYQEISGEGQIEQARNRWPMLGALALDHADTVPAVTAGEHLAPPAAALRQTPYGNILTAGAATGAAPVLARHGMLGAPAASPASTASVFAPIQQATPQEIPPVNAPIMPSVQVSRLESEADAPNSLAWASMPVGAPSGDSLTSPDAAEATLAGASVDSVEPGIPPRHGAWLFAAAPETPEPPHLAGLAGPTDMGVHADSPVSVAADHSASIPSSLPLSSAAAVQPSAGSRRQPTNTAIGQANPAAGKSILSRLFSSAPAAPAAAPVDELHGLFARLTKGPEGVAVPESDVTGSLPWRREQP